MHQELRNAIKEGLDAAFAAVASLPSPQQDMRLTFFKTGPGAWRNELRPSPSLMPFYYGGTVDWALIGRPVTEALRSHHPEHLDVGTSSARLPFAGEQLLQRMLGALWRRHADWPPPENAIDALIDELESAIENPLIPCTALAQLVNFKMPAAVEQIDLADGLVIRPLTDEEFNDIYGMTSVLDTVTLRSRPRFIQDFGIVGRFEEPKVFAGGLLSPSTAIDDVRRRFDRTVLALRTFKAGHVGYDTIRVTTDCFCPFAVFPQLGMIASVPTGWYSIEVADVEPLQEHVRLTFQKLDPSIEMACSRLADAESRTQPRDAIVDAVIGMESILLANLSNEDRRGELRYRFSLNYASLFDGAESRYRAFRLARNLYDLRSTIAHGNAMSDASVKLGSEKVNLPTAAERASGILRETVKRFLPLGKSPPYRKDGYWDRAYFGLVEDVNE